MTTYPPIPSVKPSLTGGGYSLLGDIWNSAKGVFNDLTSIELARYENKRLTDLRQGEATAKMERQNTLAGGQSFVPSLVNSNGMPNTNTYIAMAMVGAAVFILARK